MSESASSRVLAVYDFDGTMIPGDSVMLYMKLARRLHAIPLKEWLCMLAWGLCWALGGKTDAELKTRAFRFYFRLLPDRQEALNRVFVEEILTPRVYPDARAQLARDKAAGKMTLLLSASTENYMRYVAQALGFDGLICTEFENEAVVHNCKGEEKLQRLKDWLAERGIAADFAASAAYGDSMSDLPVLLFCGNGYAVNPKKKLRQAAPQLPCLVWARKQ